MSYVDLVVEVADVADDGVVAHLRHVAVHDDAWKPTGESQP